MTPPARRWTGDLITDGAVFLMGSSYPFAKEVLAVMSPLLYGASRYLVASLFLFAMMALTRRPLALPPLPSPPAAALGAGGRHAEAVNAYLAAASGWEATGRFDAALDACMRALALDPRRANAHANLGTALVALEQGQADLALFRAGKCDQALGCCLHPIALDDHQPVALAFGPAPRDQLGEIAIALGIHRQQRQTAQRAVLVAAGQPDVGAADGLDATAQRRLVELHQRAHVAHVGNGNRRHTGPRNGLDQRLYPDQPIHQRVLGMQVQVDEVGHGPAYSHSIVDGGFELMS